MTWLQLKLEGKRASAAALEDLLLATGSVAVTLEDNADQPVLEPGVGETPLWNAVRLTGLYPADTNMADVLSQFPPDTLKDTHHRIEILEDKDWEREWMEHYQPLKFGRRLWICPSWLEPPEPDDVNLMLDPGMAFGTGTHPTTDLCLREVDGLALAKQQVVDYGCGSGILALAALKLGAANALGVDNDPQALVATRDNANRNNIEPERLIICLPKDASIAGYEKASQVVIANILAGPLLELRDTLLGYLAPGGTLLLSGLLATQAEGVCAHYQPYLSMAIAGEKDGWVCLRGTLPI
ncbi:MAG: 50S ribosomal protein L11 methyltransferase [Halioglobus sp.]